jgi:hypothetical protein
MDITIDLFEQFQTFGALQFGLFEPACAAINVGQIHKAQSKLFVGGIILFGNGESTLGERFGFVVLAVRHIYPGHSPQRGWGKPAFVMLYVAGGAAADRAAAKKR